MIALVRGGDPAHQGVDRSRPADATNGTQGRGADQRELRLGERQDLSPGPLGLAGSQGQDRRHSNIRVPVSQEAHQEVKVLLILPGAERAGGGDAEETAAVDRRDQDRLAPLLREQSLDGRQRRRPEAVVERGDDLRGHLCGELVSTRGRGDPEELDQ